MEENSSQLAGEICESFSQPSECAAAALGLFSDEQLDAVSAFMHHLDSHYGEDLEMHGIKDAVSRVAGEIDRRKNVAKEAARGKSVEQKD